MHTETIYYPFTALLIHVHRTARVKREMEPGRKHKSLNHCLVLWLLGYMGPLWSMLLRMQGRKEWPSVVGARGRQTAVSKTGFVLQREHLVCSPHLLLARESLPAVWTETEAGKDPSHREYPTAGVCLENKKPP